MFQGTEPLKSLASREVYMRDGPEFVLAPFGIMPPYFLDNYDTKKNIVWKETASVFLRYPYLFYFILNNTFS